jgi:hypothetical protein
MEYLDEKDDVFVSAAKIFSFGKKFSQNGTFWAKTHYLLKSVYNCK